MVLWESKNKISDKKYHKGYIKYLIIPPPDLPGNLKNMTKKFWIMFFVGLVSAGSRDLNSSWCTHSALPQITLVQWYVHCAVQFSVIKYSTVLFISLPFWVIYDSLVQLYKSCIIWKFRIIRSAFFIGYTHLWSFSKSKFNLKSACVNLVASASPIKCLVHLLTDRAIQYKLEPEKLTRLGNSNVLRLPVDI